MQQLFSPARAGRPARPTPRAVSGEPRLAVLVPCYNEAASVEAVVRDFRRALPEADVDADAYVLVDGDATYDAADAPAMVELLLHDRLDMVNGTRVSDRRDAYRPGHRFGNVVLTSLVRAAFGAGLRDM